MTIEDIKNVADNILYILENNFKSDGVIFVKREFNKIYDQILTDFNESKLLSATEKGWDKVLKSNDNERTIKINGNHWCFSRAVFGTYRFCGEMRGYARENLEYLVLSDDSVIEWSYFEMDGDSPLISSHSMRIASSGECTIKYY